MSRIVVLGWVTALTVSLIAAELPAKSPGPMGPSTLRVSS